MTDDHSTMPAPPVIPSGTEIYDSIMGKIEQELVSAEVPKLEEKYKNETPAQWEERKNRYNAAFAKFEKEFKAYSENTERQIHDHHKSSMKMIEEMSRASDEKKLNALESSILLSP